MQKMDEYCFDWHEMLEKCSIIIIYETKKALHTAHKKYWIFICYNVTPHLLIKNYI